MAHCHSPQKDKGTGRYSLNAQISLQGFKTEPVLKTHSPKAYEGSYPSKKSFLKTDNQQASGGETVAENRADEVKVKIHQPANSTKSPRQRTCYTQPANMPKIKPITPNPPNTAQSTHTNTSPPEGIKTSGRPIPPKAPTPTPEQPDSNKYGSRYKYLHDLKIHLPSSASATKHIL